MPNPAWLRQLPNALTLGNALAGLAGMLLCARALQANEPGQAFQLAFLCIGIGVLCDTLDGPLARWLRANAPLGAQLDSLSDGASFGVATAAVIAMAFAALSVWLGAALGAFWLCAVLLRLARFNLDNDSSTAHMYFSGLCSPVAALFICALLAASHGTPAFPWLPLLAALLLPVLMLGRITFADLPKHYLARRRAPWDLLATLVLMLALSPAIGISVYLGVFVLQTLWQHARRNDASIAAP